MLTKISAAFLLTLTCYLAADPVYERNPFFQVSPSSKPSQQLQQAATTINSSNAASHPVAVVNHVDCSNLSNSPHLHHTQEPVAPVHFQHSNSDAGNVDQSSVTLNNAELNRRCLKSTGLFLGSSCNKFVSCLNGTATELNCPDGLLFNAEGLYCDRPENVECNGQSSAASQRKEEPSELSTISSPIHGNLVYFSGSGQQPNHQNNQQFHHEEHYQQPQNQGYYQQPQQHFQPHQNQQQQHTQQQQQNQQQHHNQQQHFQQINNQQQQNNQKQQQHQQQQHNQQLQQNEQPQHEQHHQHFQQQNNQQQQHHQQQQQLHNSQLQHHQNFQHHQYLHQNQQNHINQQHLHQEQHIEQVPQKEQHSSQLLHQNQQQSQHEQHHQQFQQQNNQQNHYNQQQLHQPQHNQQLQQNQQQQQHSSQLQHHQNQQHNQQEQHQQHFQQQNNQQHHYQQQQFHGQQQHNQQHEQNQQEQHNLQLQHHHNQQQNQQQQYNEQQHHNQQQNSVQQQNDQQQQNHQQIHQHQYEVHLTGTQNQQQQLPGSAANLNTLVDSHHKTVSLQELPTGAGVDAPLETNEITAGTTRCLTLRGQFPSNTCHTFLNCWGGLATEQACPDGLLFSMKGYCDYPENVNCAGRLLITPQRIHATPLEASSPPPPSPTVVPVTISTVNPSSISSLTTLPTPTSSTLPTVVAPQLKSKCLSARGQFPSTTCNKFVNCWDNIILEQECPEGFLFSTKGYCDFSQNVQCGDRPVEVRDTSQTTKSECPLENGTFRDRKKCGSYFTCTANKIVARYECPEGLSFSDYLGVCDFSYRVDCSKEPLLFPARSNTKVVPQLRRGDECPADFATYRDINNCGIYYTCVSKTIVATYACPAGFSFNDEIGICDYAEKVDCTKPPKMFQVPRNVLPQVTNDLKQQLESCTPGTMFPLNPQCTSVCLCKSGIAEIVQCPAGLAYDSKMDKCILPHLARC